MSSRTVRLRFENYKRKHNARVALLAIVRRLEDPGVQLVDYSGDIENGIVPLPHGAADCWLCQGRDGTTEYVFRLSLYDPRKNALLHLSDHANPTNLTGD